MIRNIGYHITNKWKFLNCSYDDTLVVLDSILQTTLIWVAMRIGTIGMCNNLLTLAKRFDVICYLSIKQKTVCYDDDRVVEWCIDSLCPYCIYRVRTHLYELES